MALTGSGIVPSGSIANELTAVTRRAFVPYVTVQFVKSSPFLATCIANAQTATGGVASVTVPVQGNPMTTTSAIDYSGSFAQPAVQTGIQNAEFDLAGMVTPIPFLGMEGILQMNHAIVPLIEARMNDATNNMADYAATALITTSGSSSQPTNNFIGLQYAVDDGTGDASASYGNINRNSNSWWRSPVWSATTLWGAGSGSNGAYPTRARVLQAIVGTQKYGYEMPNMGLMGPGTWASLASDYVSVDPGVSGSIYGQGNGRTIEQFNRADGGGDNETARSAYRALMVAGVPIFLDPYVPEGQLFLLNTDYINLYLHESASFAFSGFETLLSNYTLGYIGVLLTLGQLACSKPSACSRVGTVGTAASLMSYISY